MKAVLIIGGIVCAAFIAIFAASFIGAKNQGNAMEVRIDAMYQDNQNIMAQYGQKVAEAIGVTSIATDQMKQLLSGSLAARYGDKGAQAGMLAIQESFPNLDQTKYTEIQRIIEAGRNDFQVAQTKLVDAKRVYVTALGSFPNGSFMSMAGYPRINIGYPLGTKDDYPIISTARAQSAFKTGTECGNAVTAANNTDGCH